jgi:hypothetical protein
VIKLSLDRLVELMQAAGPDVTAAAILEQWKQEYHADIAELEARAKQAARDNPVRFGVRRVEEAVQESAGRQLPVLRAVEHYAIRADELAAFAKHIQARPEDLRELVEGKRRDLVTKRGVWHAWEAPRWSSSRLYVDRTQQDELRAELEREDEKTKQWVDAWNARREASPGPQPDMPSFIEWSK